MESLSITLIQTELYWENPSENIRMLDEKIRSVSKTQIVVLPEMFSTGFSMKPHVVAERMDGPCMNWMKKISADKKIILTGSLAIEENGKYYNRMIWMMPDGNYGFYDKRHLFAYSGEDKVFTPGTKRFITSVNGWRILLQVCYDLRFPVWGRQQTRTGSESINVNKSSHEYDAIIYVANWPQVRSHPWKILLAARAMENQCYVIGVNRTGKDGNDIMYSGDSMIIDPSGEILQHKTGSEEIFTTVLSRDVLNEFRNKYPFINDADAFTLLV
jgi:predicted amidohydrolase